MKGNSTLVRTCTNCGQKFVFSREAQEYYRSLNWQAPNTCFECRKKRKQELEAKREEVERAERQKKWEQNQKEFESRISSYPAVTITPSAHTLYIIGNGFDLMHRVPSSYYSFRDSLGKNSKLRQTLETYLTPEDIWADFEDALAHFNADMMANPEIIDMWLDDFDAYSLESMADYYAAIGSAVLPMEEMSLDLPKRFRQWVEKLTVGTDDRPLAGIIDKDGKVLDFNYTEFIETLYGLSKNNVCYVHGCRRKEKYHPKETLILGHRPGASDAVFDNVKWRKPKNYKSAVVSMAQEEAIRQISAYDEEFTKDCDVIIKNHEAFFSSLNDIDQIICIGHSYSEVDWPYFREIKRRTNAKWICGCYGLQDLNNLEALCNELGIGDVQVFRTDTFSTAPNAVPAVIKAPKNKIRTLAEDKPWSAKADGRDFLIEKDGRDVLRLQFGSSLNWACFVNNYLVLVTGEDGVFLFGLDDGGWKVINELKSVNNQYLINARLKHVMVTGEDITFVYNNLIRKYSLSDGMVVANNHIRGAGKMDYPGTDIKNQIVPKWMRD